MLSFRSGRGLEVRGIVLLLDAALGAGRIFDGFRAVAGSVGGALAGVCEFAFCAVDFFAGGFFDAFDGAIDQLLKWLGDELQIRVSNSWS